MNFSIKRTLAFASASAMIAVILGALAAHALPPHLSETQMHSFETAVRFQMYHSLALLALPLLNLTGISVSKWVIGLMMAGILLFSGSIYLLATRPITGLPIGFLGPVTPLGGVCLIASWGLLFWNILKKK
ncbi:DUF423 domain-containing protein [bacterium SCSIO 12741]|nr:DUF423 domain-containing protein [bacterium SCSIO 12741]